MSSRRALAPRRYTCWTSPRRSGVSTCIIRRTTRGMAPGTSISMQHSSGTSWKPSARAASAGDLGAQIGRGREDHADHLVGAQAVPFHHLGHELGRAVQYLLPLVRRNLDGTPDGPDGHSRSLPRTYMPTAAYRSPISASDSRRVLPGRSDPRLTGPTCVRTSRLTGWPASASM